MRTSPPPAGAREGWRLPDALAVGARLAAEGDVVAQQEGTRRALHPAETVQRLRGLLPVLGITRLADVTGLDRVGIPVFVAVRPNSRSLSTSQGKGLTRDAARASALMESVESWHAERVHLPLVLASYDELQWSRAVVDVLRLPLLRHSALTGARRLLWVEGVRLGDGLPELVPYELVHTDYTLPKPTGAGCFLPSSNGLASGNTAAEALLHALCELVERDATTLWELAPPELKDASRLDLDTVAPPSCRGLLEALDRGGVAVGVWDATSDLGVPTFVCIAAERDDDALHPVHSAAGMGTHPLPEVALGRALTEAAQSRLTITTGSREDVLRQDYDRVRDPEVLRRGRDVVAGRGTRPYGAVRPAATGGTDDGLRAVLAALRRVGCGEPVAVPLTRPEIGVPVVRVVVPGLESAHRLPGWSPGERARALVPA